MKKCSKKQVQEAYEKALEQSKVTYTLQKVMCYLEQMEGQLLPAWHFDEMLSGKTSVYPYSYKVQFGKLIRVSDELNSFFYDKEGLDVVEQILKWESILIDEHYVNGFLTIEEWMKENSLTKNDIRKSLRGF
jgi:hypothetical protein